MRMRSKSLLAPRRPVRLAVFLAAVFVTVFLLFPPFESRPILLFPSTSSQPEEITFRKSSFDWATVEQHHPVTSFKPLPTGKPLSLPSIQHEFGVGNPHPEAPKRQKAVRDVFIRSWNSYKKFAWGRDELAPVSAGAKDTFGGWAATLVDSLDTLWIMELKDEFRAAANVAVKLDWANTTATSVNMFETTIRHLGGLLSAYDLSGEPALLEKAKELGDMLYMGFDTPNRLPGFWVNFEDARNGTQLAGTHDPSASPGSLAMEFTRLSQLTGNPKYFDAVDRITRFLEGTQFKSKLPGMWPKMINFREERVDTDNSFTLGALADSLYEYLPKMFALLGGRDPSYEKMYIGAMAIVEQHILFRPMVPDRDDILFAGDAFIYADRIEHVSDGQHLACFAGGMLGLGGRLFSVDNHVALGEKVARGCAWAYDAFPSGVMPENFNLIPCEARKTGDTQKDDECLWDEPRWKSEGDPRLKKGFRNARDPRYILRPEAIESIFLLYRMTGRQDLQEIAWRMFESILKATETEHAHSAIADVTVPPDQTRKLDEMESFWLAETLKYFYLIFSPPDLISLDDYVLNTEAHPFKIPK
ncbi:glycosyl hydrolase family 47 [Colletotrichum filicis]|nr:glycosyl hydrolase family 47 [Colletotrichum filicis]